MLSWVRGTIGPYGTLFGEMYFGGIYFGAFLRGAVSYIIFISIIQVTNERL